MELRLKALIVDANAVSADSLKAALRPDIELDTVDYTNALHKGIMSLREEQFHLCFISEVFPLSEVEIFARDLQKIDAAKTTLFVRINASEKEIDPGQTEAAPQKLPAPFTLQTSRRLTAKEKAGIVSEIRKKFIENEVHQKTINVNSALNVMLKELDAVASDRKRGYDAKFNQLANQFIASQTKYNAEVLERYFKALVDKTAESKPNQETKIDVPEEVLKRGLPKLTADSYVGTSRRVWKKVSKKFKDKAATAPSPGELNSELSEQKSTEVKSEKGEP